MVGYPRLKSLLFVFVSLSLAGAIKAYDPNWCGNKHHNLVQLSSIVQGISDVQIPEFRGISTGRIESYLQQHAPEIYKEYAGVVRYLNAQKQSKLKFYYYSLVNKIKSQSIENILLNIKNKIKSVFGQYSFEFTEDEKRFFDLIYQNCQFVMVRSTGIEDSQTVANAGGNVSCCYIKPELWKIQSAMGEVVASYFSMQSLKNRLGGGEKLSTELCIPVLIQELVGEVPNGVIDDAAAIPVSGVAFTTNQTLSSESIKVTEINASYGHGEGVVANKVQTDKYYMLPSRNSNDILIYPALSYKPERLIPKSFDLYYSSSYSVSIDRTSNSEDLSYKSSLSQKQLKKLYQVLQRIEQAYEKPMDVEFVVLGSQLYIVQARPAMHVQVNPSFVPLDRLPAENIVSSMETITIAPGKAQVLVITNPDEIIISRTLDEADQMLNSATAKAVLVGKWASSLSHAAVNFMSHGTPCLYIQNYSQLEQLKSQISKAQPLVIDVQQRMIFLWNDNYAHRIEQFIKKGWYECPIAGTLSISLDQLPPMRLHQNPLPLDAQLVSLVQKLKTASDKPQKSDLLEKIVHRVNQFFLLTERRMMHLAQFNGESCKKVFDLFKNQFNQHIEQMRSCIEHEGESIEFLLYHKILEAFLFQQPGNRSVLNGFNYSYFLNELYSNQQLCMFFRKLQMRGLDKRDTLYTASQFAPKDLASQWNEWALVWNKLAESNQEVKEQIIFVSDLVSHLEKIEALPLWFATEFYQTVQYGNNDENIEKIKKLIKELEERDLSSVSKKDFAAQLGLFILNKEKNKSLQLLVDLESYKKRLETIYAQKKVTFSSLEEAQEIWNKLLNDIIQPMTEQTFFDNFKQAPSFIQFIACDFMRECIDIVDSTIKALKASAEISLEDRVAEFKTMLTGFKQLYINWSMQIMPHHSLQYHENWPLKDYNEGIEQLFNEIVVKGQISQDLFLRSPEFAVNAAMIGSRTAFDRHYPQTAEDMFMLIHQNALMIVAGTASNLLHEKTLSLSEQLYLPEQEKQFLNYVESLLSQQIEPNYVRIGIEYNTDLLKLAYNIPLRNHSATCQLIYNHATQQWSIAVQFLGQARKRWKQVKILASLSPELSHLELMDDVLLDEKSGITSWQWLIKDQDQLPLILKYLAIMSSLSYEINLRLDHLQEIQPNMEIIKKALTHYKKNHTDDQVTIENLLYSLGQ